MKKILMAVIVSVCAVSAMAADAPKKAPKKPPKSFCQVFSCTDTVYGGHAKKK